jgi:hypothetical protein
LAAGRKCAPQIGCVARLTLKALIDTLMTPTKVCVKQLVFGLIASIWWLSRFAPAVPEPATVRDAYSPDAILPAPLIKVFPAVSKN